MRIDRLAPVSVRPSLQLPHAPSDFHSGIILHEHIILLNLLAISEGITLDFGWV